MTPYQDAIFEYLKCHPLVSAWALIDEKEGILWECWNRQEQNGGQWLSFQQRLHNANVDVYKYTWSVQHRERKLFHSNRCQQYLTLYVIV